jgi:hypothetical protein
MQAPGAAHTTGEQEMMDAVSLGNGKVATGTAEVNWYVAIATQNGHERLARVELDARGFDVHVPTEFRRQKIGGHIYVTADKLILAPYFFVRFNGADDEEWALVLAQRGVRHVLTNSRGKPSPIPPRIVAAHRSREYAEQHLATKRREKADASLPLNLPYRIMRGVGEGHTGTLIGIDRGIAFLDINGITWKPQLLDIAPVEARPKAG